VECFIFLPRQPFPAYQELLRALIEIHPRPRGLGPLQAGSRRLSQGLGSAINSLRHGEVEHTRKSLAKCRIARISSSASLVSSKGNSTEEAHSRSRRPNMTSETKAAREEPPFLKWGRSGQKMNLPVIWAIL
jgi:hypothetical protein